MSNSNLITKVIISPDPDTYVRYIEEEKAVGIDYEQIEKKYYFAFNDNSTVPNPINQQSTISYAKLECIFVHPSYITPSRRDKMTENEELRLRILGSQMIIEAGYSLKIPWFTIATCQSIFQRFYVRYSFPLFSNSLDVPFLTMISKISLWRPYS